MGDRRHSAWEWRDHTPFDDHFALIILIFLYIDNFCGGLRTFV
jgi:hypothetical protein